MANTTTATVATPTKGTRGRKLDNTPGKTFAAKKTTDNGDGTAVYQIPYNDKHGVRQTRQENRTIGKRGGKGRSPDRNPSKVLTPKFERGENGNLILTVPFNDKNGERTESQVVLSVNSKGNLSAKIS